MFITQVYKYRKDNIIYVGGELPIDAEVLETLNILNAEDGYDLVIIATDENIGSSVWLKEGDSEDNYKEIPQEIEE